MFPKNFCKRRETGRKVGEKLRDKYTQKGILTGKVNYIG